MNKLQIQLPTPLYKKLKLISSKLDYSLAELLRRGAEQIVLFYPQIEESKDLEWEMPEPKKLGLKRMSAEDLKLLAYDK